MRSAMLVFCLSAVTVCSGQRSTIYGVGGSPLPPISSGQIDLTPGEVFYLYVRFAEPSVLERFPEGGVIVPASSDWPQNLAGFSARVRVDAVSHILDYPLPIGGLRRLGTVAACAQHFFPSDCASTVIVKTQFPFEAAVPNRGPLAFFASLPATLTVETDGMASGPVQSVVIQPRHIRTEGCDEAIYRNGNPCGDVYHADGERVTDFNPAAEGQRLYFRAYGLGITDPPVRTGEPSPAPAIGLSGGALAFDFAAPTLPLLPGSTTKAQDRVRASAVELKPGEVGVYEVRFVMPAVPKDIRACGQRNPSQLGPNAGVTFYLNDATGNTIYFCAK